MRCDIKNHWKNPKPTAHQVIVQDYLALVTEARSEHMVNAAKHWERITEMRRLLWVDYGIKRPEDFVKVTVINPA